MKASRFAHGSTRLVVIVQPDALQRNDVVRRLVLRLQRGSEAAAASPHAPCTRRRTCPRRACRSSDTCPCRCLRHVSAMRGWVCSKDGGAARVAGGNGAQPARWKNYGAALNPGAWRCFLLRASRHRCADAPPHHFRSTRCHTRVPSCAPRLATPTLRPRPDAQIAAGTRSVGAVAGPPRTARVWHFFLFFILEFRSRSQPRFAHLVLLILALTLLRCRSQAMATTAVRLLIHSRPVS